MSLKLSSQTFRTILQKSPSTNKRLCSPTTTGWFMNTKKYDCNRHLFVAQIPFSAFARSKEFMEAITVKVPTMGDSITEGTVVEWTVEIGQAVKEGDVVALVETDKVTVDIKAEADGVLISQHCSVDDTVEVGSDLYQLDTEAEAFTTTPSDTINETVVASTETPEIVSTTTPEPFKNKEIGRIPSIHFLGKEGWKMRRESIENDASLVEPLSQPSTVFVPNMDPMYGRPPFTEAEMEALIMGGANIAPQVESFSNGAVFR